MKLKIPTLNTLDKSGMVSIANAYILHSNKLKGDYLCQ
jgi:hypothetical protein